MEVALPRKIADGTLELVAKLGSGSYGTVYRAVVCDRSLFDEGAPSEFAVKAMINPGPQHRRYAACQREARLQARSCGHPNVLSIHAIVEDDDFIFYVLDYATGGDLYNAIISDVFATRDQLVKAAFLQLVDAVEFCHSVSVYHRDIKPENVLLTDDEQGGVRLLLADFGLATEIRSCKDYGTGSALYMSPQCRAGPGFRDMGPYDAVHNDIWALGVVLCTLLTGRAPWRSTVLSDEFFHSYCRSPDNFIGRTLPVTEQCAALLRRMFALGVRDGCTPLSMAELRTEVEKMDTFVLDEASCRASPRFSVRTVGAAIWKRRHEVDEMQKLQDITSATSMLQRVTLSSSSGAASSGAPVTPEMHAITEAQVVGEDKLLHVESQLDLIDDTADEIVTVPKEVAANASPKVTNSSGGVPRQFLETFVRRVRRVSRTSRA